MGIYIKILFLLYITTFNDQIFVCGHGRLWKPPGRSTIWRLDKYKGKAVENTDDNFLYCGGISVQYDQNKGKCGICGDPYNGVRENEVPNGKYAKKLIISETYKMGQTITAMVQLTAAHMGYFTFKICPAKSSKKEVTESCLNKHRLKVMNSKSKYKYLVGTSSAGNFTMKLKLPDDLKCKRCVFQWTYTAGNNWGICKDGKGALGCGNQETFRACADIRIK